MYRNTATGCAGMAAGGGALGDTAREARARADARGAVGAQQGRVGRAAPALGVRPGRAAGQQAMYLVHSAYF